MPAKYDKYKNNGYASVVEADYSGQVDECDKDNIFITALHGPVVDLTTLYKLYSKEITFNESEEKSKTDSEKRCSLLNLRKVRVPLPFMTDLELEFYNALITSYRSRHLQFGNYKDEQKTRLISSTGSSTNPGFALLGYSGCGKSTAIGMLIDHWPQVITHHLDNGDTIQQIVYLTVSCAANGNLSSVYDAIGVEIDHALNTDIFKDMIFKEKRLDKKRMAVERLIERFNIGIIILDEIQLLDLKSNKESSFESLMVISNNTKVAFGLIGTEDTYKAMFNKLRTARRFGKPINASGYSVDKDFYKFILASFWKYQWFDKKLSLTKSLVNTLYENTKGLMDQTVSMLISIQDEYFKMSYIDKDKTVRPTVNSEFIDNVSNKYYKHLKELLEDLDDVDNRIEIEKMMAAIKVSQDMSVKEISQSETINSLIEIGKIEAKEEYIRQTIQALILTMGMDYKADTIEEVVREEATELDEMEDAMVLTQISKKKLESMKKQLRKPKKKPTMDYSDMLTEITTNNENAENDNV